jgi:hypothetical protein
MSLISYKDYNRRSVIALYRHKLEFCWPECGRVYAWVITQVSEPRDLFLLIGIKDNKWIETGTPLTTTSPQLQMIAVDDELIRAQQGMVWEYIGTTGKARRFEYFYQPDVRTMEDYEELKRKIGNFVV